MIVDTDVLIAYFRGHDKAKKCIEKCDAFSISVVTYIELVQGMKNKQELNLFKQMLLQWPVNVIQINEIISAKAMFYVEQYCLSHKMQLADGLIAATAVTQGMPLLSGNVKHFKYINELELQAFKH